MLFKTFTLCALLHGLSGVAARLQTDKDPIDPLALDLSVMDKVLFSVFVVHAGCTFFQISSGHREIRDEKVHRLPYILSFVSILLHLGTYIMRAIQVALGSPKITKPRLTLAELPPPPPIVTGDAYRAVTFLTFRLGHVVLVGAVMLMVYQRMEIFARKQKSTPLFPTWKKVLDGILFLIAVGLAGAAASQVKPTFTPTYLALQRASTGSLVLCVFNLWMSAIVLRSRMSRTNFHDGYIRHIAFFITPLIFIQSLNLIVYEIMYGLWLKLQFEWNAYRLAYSIILGLSSVASTHMFQALYRQAPVSEQAWQLKEMDREKWRE